MTTLTRFGISLDRGLLGKFDRHIKSKNYRNRSEAVRDLIREELVKTEWLRGSNVAGAITLVYDHHRRELLNKLTDLQHDFHNLIISSQHIHLDGDNCLEMLAVKGRPKEIETLAHKLKSTKGVKFCKLSPATTGREIT